MAFKHNMPENELASLPVDGMNRVAILERTVDFRESNLAQTEIMSLFKIPAHVLVEEVMMIVLIADAHVTDVDVGSFTTAGVAVVGDGFIDGGTLAAPGLVRDLAGETYSLQDGTAGLMGAAEWCVGILNNDADTINDAVVKFIAVVKDLR